MTSDSDFYKHLGTLQNGSILQGAYDLYKSSQNKNSFVLNGMLRAGLDLGEYQTEFNKLNGIFRAKNNNPLCLYRMTSTAEFTPSGAEVSLGLSFRYPAFLSTTRDINVLQGFVPPTGTPVILIINCPINTGMALMEGNHNKLREQEVLLQPGAEYKITNSEKIVCKSKIEHFLGKHNANNHELIYVITMDAINNSPVLDNVSEGDFYLF
ncbi:hypothetical protein [Morganella sp. GD04133]|uniref:hypothetical protein n=1 Tax=Morganella sp. GD04133 TaxID=2975435 RepID=UPI0024486025|nr:hypothetical protein [Morganella sp. GD04133]MDH0356266.1 ADP-ribosyltransferase [Morganella sp. GD04133]